MRQLSVTVTILYEDDKDDLALVVLDKMGDWLIDIDSLMAFDKEFHDPQDVDESDPMWEDYFWDWEDNNE
jgi:hypothetical protein